MLRMLAAADRLVDKLLRLSVITAMIVLLALVSSTVFNRKLPVLTILGWEEIVELFFGWLVFLGALSHCRNRTMFSVTTLHDALGAPWNRYLRALVGLLMLCFSAVMVAWGTEFALDTIETTPVLSVPKNFWYLAIPVTGVGMFVYSLAHLWNDIRGVAPTPTAPAEPTGLA